LPASQRRQLCQTTAPMASRRWAVRAMRPGMVWAPWRSSESWSLYWSRIASTHCRTPPRLPKRGVSSRRSGAQEGAAEGGDELLDVGARQPFVADHRVAGEVDPLEHLADYLAFGDVGRGELEGDRHPIGRRQRVELEAPEVARVGGTPTVGGVAGELRSLQGLVRLPAGHGGGVDEPQVVAPRGRDPRQPGEHADDLRGERPDALVVARLAGM
jgi:hypothetical protein